MASGDSGTLISIDSIDEFKTEENPRAEYGWKPGGIVNVALSRAPTAITGPPTLMAAMAPGMRAITSTRRRQPIPH